MILHVDDINHNLPIILKSIDNVESIEFSQPTLDDVFYTFTQGKIAEEPEGVLWNDMHNTTKNDNYYIINNKIQYFILIYRQIIK